MRLCDAHFRQEISRISRIAKENLFRKTLRRKITRTNLRPLERSLDHQNISLRSVLFASKHIHIHIHARARLVHIFILIIFWDWKLKYFTNTFFDDK